MGVIQISSPSARLAVQASTPVRQVRMPNHAIANLNGIAERRNAGLQSLAKGVQDLGKAALDITLRLEADRRRAEDAEIESAFERHLRDSFMGIETKDTSGNPLGALAQESGAAKGILTRMRESTRMADLQEAVEQGGELISDKAFKQFLDDHNYSRKNRDDMLHRMQRLALPWENHLQMGYLDKSKKISIEQADTLFQEKLRTWKGSIGRGLDNDVMAMMTQDVLDSFAASQEARGASLPKVLEDVAAIESSMAKDYASVLIGKFNTETEIDAALTDIDEDPWKIFSANPGLMGNFGRKDIFDAETKTHLKTELERRRQVVKSRKRADVAYLAAPGFESANTIWDPNDPTKKNPNRLIGVERAIDHLNSSLKGVDTFGNEIYAQGSAERAYLEENLQKLNQMADSIASEELLERMLAEAKMDPKNPPRIWTDGELAPDILPGSREAHLAEKVQKFYDANYAPSTAETRAEHTANLNAYKLLALEYAAKGDMAGYKELITDAALKGDFSLNEWKALNSEFDDAWTKSEGGNASQKEIFARQALAVVQSTFGGDLTEAYQVDKKGEIKFNAKSGYEGAEYERHARDGFRGFLNSASYVLQAGSGRANFTRTKTLSPENVRELADTVSLLAKFNGQKINFDPITLSREKCVFDGWGESSLDPEKPFDAVDYFKRFCDYIKKAEYVDENEDYVAMLVKARENLESAQAYADDANRLEIFSVEDARKEQKLKPRATTKRMK